MRLRCIGKRKLASDGGSCRVISTPLDWLQSAFSAWGHCTEQRLSCWILQLVTWVTHVSLCSAHKAHWFWCSRSRIQQLWCDWCILNPGAVSLINLKAYQTCSVNLKQLLTLAWYDIVLNIFLMNLHSSSNASSKLYHTYHQTAAAALAMLSLLRCLFVAVPDVHPDACMWHCSLLRIINHACYGIHLINSVMAIINSSCPYL